MLFGHAAGFLRVSAAGERLVRNSSEEVLVPVLAAFRRKITLPSGHTASLVQGPLPPMRSGIPPLRTASMMGNISSMALEQIP